MNELAVLQAKRSNETNGDICPSRKPAEFFPKRVKQPCTAARRRGDISNLGISQISNVASTGVSVSPVVASTECIVP